MRRLRRPAMVVIVMLLTAATASCAPASPGAEAGPRVFFTEPANGASVSSPVHVEMDAENFTIEPAGEVKEGAGHLHIMVDTDCLAAGQTIPQDETHLHFGDGQTSADIELAPGAHTLCLQAGNGVHTALEGDGLRHTVSITVE